jgi:hypothetical protein
MDTRIEGENGTGVVTVEDKIASGQEDLSRRRESRD